MLGQEGGSWQVGYVPNVTNRHGVIKSGVTILFGFDLGQQNKKDIELFPIDTSIKEKLYPFIGLTGRDAVVALQRSRAREKPRGSTGELPRAQGVVNRKGAVTQWVALNPSEIVHRGKTVAVKKVTPELEKAGLVLTDHEAKALAPHAKGLYLTRLAKAFNNAARKKRRPHFGVLRSGVQTALMSLSWHRGNIWNMKHHAPERRVFDAGVEGRWEDVVMILREAFNDTQFAKRRRDEGNLVARAMGIDQMTPSDALNLTNLLNQVFPSTPRVGEARNNKQRSRPDGRSASRQRGRRGASI